jgi:hypothetical protein
MNNVQGGKLFVSCQLVFFANAMFEYTFHTVLRFRNPFEAQKQSFGT